MITGDYWFALGTSWFWFFQSTSGLGHSFQTCPFKLQVQIWVHKLFKQAEIGKAATVLTEAKEHSVWAVLLSFVYSPKYNSAVLLLLTPPFLSFLTFSQIVLCKSLGVLVLNAAFNHEAPCLTRWSQWFLLELLTGQGIDDGWQTLVCFSIGVRVTIPYSGFRISSIWKDFSTVKLFFL